MIYRENNEFKLFPHQINYTQNGRQEVNHTSDKSTWHAYLELGHITDLSFENVEYTVEQLARLEETKDYEESEYESVKEYVLNNVVVESSKIAENKRAEINQQTLDMLVMSNLGVI